MQVHGVRLLELTDRGSSVMQVSEVDEYTMFDPVINAFKVLGQLYNLAVSGEAFVVPFDSYADVLVTQAADEHADLMLLPWSETGNMNDPETISSDSVKHRLESEPYANFVSSALSRATCNTAIFINKGFSGTLTKRPSALTRSMSHVSSRKQAETTLPAVDRSHHVFMPFFGGNDGRAALRLVLQLAENPEVTATIVSYVSSTANTGTEAAQQQVLADGEAIDNSTVSTATDLDDGTYFATLHRSLPADHAVRVVFETSAQTSVPDALKRAQEELAINPKNGGDLLVVGRSSNASSDKTCFGDIGQQFVDVNMKASLLILQARTLGYHRPDMDRYA